MDSLKKTSGLGYCMDKQSDAWGTGFASLFLLSWLHIPVVLSGNTGVLGYARRCREPAFAGGWKLCSLTSFSFLGNAEAGRGAGGVPVSQSINHFLMFIIYPPGQTLPSFLPLWAMGIFVISEQQRLAGSLSPASSSFSAM